MIRDALFLAGAASFLTGLWWMWPPLALIVGGLVLSAAGWIVRGGS